MHWLRATHIRLLNESGQTLAEYGVLLVAIAVVVIAAAVVFGVNVTGLFTKSANGV